MPMPLQIISSIKQQISTSTEVNGLLTPHESMPYQLGPGVFPLEKNGSNDTSPTFKIRQFQMDFPGL